MTSNRHRKRYLIGLTGNIATGKTEVARMLSDLGAEAIDADKVAHQVMRPGGGAYDAVVDAFGAGILHENGTVNRVRLGAIVFRDAQELRRLESAVHPAVQAKVSRLIAAAKEPIVVVEAIKLIESGMHRGYDSLWVVTAPRHVQIARLMEARGLSEDEAALRVDAQPSQEEKAALADVVIVNDGDLAELRQKVVDSWLKLPGCITVRAASRTDLGDAAGMARVLNSVIGEKAHTALTGHWTPEDELAFLQGLGPRSEVFVAEVDGQIVGFQVIEPFVTYTSTMSHVCHFGTYVLHDFRGRGVGRALAATTLGFAQAQGYGKSVVYVLADNVGGQAYYRSLGFEPRGVLKRQVKIDGAYHDEVFMELHFEDTRIVTD
jgi:dephospho-CoA kinase